MIHDITKCLLLNLHSRINKNFSRNACVFRKTAVVLSVAKGDVLKEIELKRLTNLRIAITLAK